MEIFLKVWILFQLIPSGWAEISNAEYEEVMQVYKSRFNEFPGPGGRIAGGLPGSQDLFSYQVALVLNNSRALMICGGSIISENWVLTAAHCFHDIVNGFVLAGTNSLKNGNPPYVGRVAKENLISHPNYNNSILGNNDIALAYLTRKLNFTNPLVSPIKLPTTLANDPTYYVNRTGTVSGYGLTSDGKNATTSSTLQYVELKVLPEEDCINMFRLELENSLCVGTKDGKSACRGDSGGPFIIDCTVTGVVSFGGNRCQANIPVVFTRVSAFLDWIGEKTNITIY